MRLAFTGGLILANQPDLILMDIQLPGKDGFALLEEIRHSRHHRPSSSR